MNVYNKTIQDSSERKNIVNIYEKILDTINGDMSITNMLNLYYGDSGRGIEWIAVDQIDFDELWLEIAVEGEKIEMIENMKEEDFVKIFGVQPTEGLVLIIEPEDITEQERERIRDLYNN